MFAISKAKIEFMEKHNMRDNRETEMMDFGGKYLNFTTERHGMSKKVLFLVLYLLLNWFFLETLTDVVPNICL